ncbi:ABC-type multidrug transport system, ATPase component [Methanocella conradii HZ254]|uniref:ABC-type multidrug transport system, ATPase component n=1 Tax=Methanocella conradii (strain DSM 24694 / JCM 17849 / CGMCC 1.5162 / HZ254) TaxID=1041930 RepID=H8I8M0_METCZ|nr:ABC transporter ATP-binding protein [Methanocella conradii]AFC99496.1 ABC-type multidrug transport system, ATPase component [Methanocella conradii HZ254]MDI6898056.1 ABC transporter ATP-binding protein [Methanocella conradii]
MVDSVIETSGLTKKYDEKVVVKDLDLRVFEGEAFGFLGPNGAGKTTTIKMLMGLVQPSSGTGRVCGFDIVHQVLDVRRSCGVLPEPAGFYDNLTARQNLRFYGSLYGLRGRELEEKVLSTLKLVGLSDAVDLKIGKFSKGMKQRFGLAQAIVHDPRVLIFDEPTAGIDPQGAEDYRLLVKELKSRGKTVFMTSHILPEVEAVCDRIGIIVNGEMKICGNVDELVDQYTRRQGYRLKLRVKELDERCVMESLKRVEGISNVTRNNGYYLISSGEDVSEEVSRVLCKSSGVVTELEVYRPSLNEIFLEVTRPETGK